MGWGEWESCSRSRIYVVVKEGSLVDMGTPASAHGIDTPRIYSG
jgi:hypothetical protein